MAFRTIDIQITGEKIPYKGDVHIAEIAFKGSYGWNPPESIVRDTFRTLVVHAQDEKSWYESYITKCEKIHEDSEQSIWEVMCFTPYVD